MGSRTDRSLFKSPGNKDRKVQTDCMGQNPYYLQKNGWGAIVLMKGIFIPLMQIPAGSKKQKKQRFSPM